MTILAPTPDPTTLVLDEAVEARDEQGRFTSEVGRDAVFDLVQTVALRATSGDIDAAERVTTRAWNEARAGVFALGPGTASAVTKALGLPWRDCVMIGLLPPGKRAVATAAREPGQGREATDELIRRALRAVAHRLKSTPLPDAYDHEVALIEAERARRFGVEFGLPSARTIRSHYDSWHDACRDADLDPPQTPLVLVPEPWQVYLDCVRETGCAPSKAWFEKWCRIRQRQLAFETFSVTVEKAQAAWSNESDDPWPAACPRRQPLPEEDPSVEGDRRRRNFWTDERILDALRRYIKMADAEGATITQRHYRRVARDHKQLDLPSASLLTRKGNLADLIQLARSGATRLS